MLQASLPLPIEHAQHYLLKVGMYLESINNGFAIKLDKRQTAVCLNHAHHDNVSKELHQCKSRGYTHWQSLTRCLQDQEVSQS